LGGSSSWGDCNDPRDGPSSGIGPGQTQIIDMVGVVRSKRTSRERVGEVLWWSRNWCADRVGVRSRCGI